MKMLMAVAVVTAVAACDFAGEDATNTRFAERGITLQIPSTWTVTGFSKGVTRLVTGSYDVRPGDVEGECGAHAAVERLPRDGAYIVLIDYGHADVNDDAFTDELPVSASDMPFSEDRLGEFACFGTSYLFRFVVEGRALQVHIGLGLAASDKRKDEALTILNSVAVEP